MELRLLRIFQRQVVLQCKFLILSAQEINENLNELNSEKTFYAIQNFLNAGANISKALWGQGGRLADEREQLRDSAGISDSSPLREISMRNNFEHFDERLDRWLAESLGHNYADMNIVPKDTFARFDKIDSFRTFDPDTTDIVF